MLVNRLETEIRAERAFCETEKYKNWTSEMIEQAFSRNEKQLNSCYSKLSIRATQFDFILPDLLFSHILICRRRYFI